MIKRTDRRQEYVERVTHGEGFMPWQSRERTSPEEVEFRRQMVRRKDDLLKRRRRVVHPALYTTEETAIARRNSAETEWGKAWFAGIKTVADHVAAQPDGYIETMISELTPTNHYGFTCPHCVGTKSQEGARAYMFAWNCREPEIIRCKTCNQTYPDMHYPETGQLACPRRGQTFTYYINESERAHPEDRSGSYAWKWVGHPIHVSFSGIIRHQKVLFMLDAARSLGLAYRLTGKPRYAEQAVQILQRFAVCVPNWLYHDYWDTVADCDPLYAAWHDTTLPLEWKRHACGAAYAGDDDETGSMLRNYWGAGRIHTSADAWVLNSLCPAYDLTYDAVGADGKPVWTPAWRRRIERDLLLEYAFGAEPFLGGAGKADNLTNKSAYVYYPFAELAVTLGLADFADVALRGYIGLRDQSFVADGFSTESPAYTNLYLSNLIFVPEVLHGFRWPHSFPGRKGTVDVYKDDTRLQLMLQAELEALRTNGQYLPLSDTLVEGVPSPHIFEIALKRFPVEFTGALPAIYRGGSTTPGEYAVFHLTPAELSIDNLQLPEILFPTWQTAVLRHGDSVLALPFNFPGGHRHADSLALYYADRGQPVLGELGYVNDSAMLAWGHSTLSHNLVVVDDSEQRFDERAPSLRLMVTSPRVSVVEAESNAYDQCQVYRRLVALLKGPEGRTVAVDIFRVQGGGKHAYRLFSEVAASDACEGALEFTGLAMPTEDPLPDFGGSISREHVVGLRDTRSVAHPPASWQATWQEDGRCYRLHVLCPLDAVEASNGPGQETLQQVGRRLRYLDLINRGNDLASTFVTVHEPGDDTILTAERLPVPAAAGPDAVALHLETAWGGYLIFSDFTGEAEVAGICVKSQFAIFGTKSGASHLRLVCGEQMWSGQIVEQTLDALTVSPSRPASWPTCPLGVTTYVLAGDGSIYTGYPIKRVEERRIEVNRFPLQVAKRFVLPSVEYEEQDG